MVNIFNPKQPKPNPPKWLRWAILGFALLAAMNAYRANVNSDEETLKTENYPKLDDFISADRWQRIMNPHYDRTEEVAAPDADENPTDNNPKEPENHEPDSQSPASDQTVTDDGGDSESR